MAENGTDTEAQLEDLKKRVTRLEAALDEMARGAVVYLRDKLYEEKERKEARQ